MSRRDHASPAIACRIRSAIVAAPSVVLADEPTSALDGENGQAIMKVLAQIARDGSRAVLVVTHDPRILPFANRVVRIEDGRIVGEESAAHGALEMRRGA